MKIDYDAYRVTPAGCYPRPIVPTVEFVSTTWMGTDYDGNR